MLGHVHIRQKGFSLVEMLVATLVLSFGLLGIAGLQTLSLRNNNNAYMSTQANLLAYDIVDSMRANRDAALNNDYNMSMGGSVPTSNALAQADLTAWLANLNVLPDGQGSVACNTSDVCQITVRWIDYGNTVNATSISLSTEI